MVDKVLYGDCVSVQFKGGVPAVMAELLKCIVPSVDMSQAFAHELALLSTIAGDLNKYCSTVLCVCPTIGLQIIDGTVLGHNIDHILHYNEVDDAAMIDLRRMGRLVRWYSMSALPPAYQQAPISNR